MQAAFKSFLSNFFTTKKVLTSDDIDHSVKAITADGICSSAMGTLQGGAFLSAFAITIGASNYEIGLLATFAFLSQLIQIPGLMLVRALKIRRPIILACAFTGRVLWVFIYPHSVFF